MTAEVKPTKPVKTDKDNPTPPISSDQCDFNLGIRDLPEFKDAPEGQFNEPVQPDMGGRRDPEESRYDEAGQKISQ